ncbi:MAG: hypothetical protein ACFFG0_35635, partial [Candidatus Thorarchaeota archaeon]
IIMFILELPIWFALLPFKFLIGILNLIPCKLPKICEKDSFLKPHPSGQSIPMRYTILLQQKLGLGHLIVSYIRGIIRTEKIFQVENIYDELGLKKDCKIIKNFLEKVISIEDLNQIKKDCQFLS